jgi:hypothetical protein
MRGSVQFVGQQIDTARTWKLWTRFFSPEHKISYYATVLSNPQNLTAFEYCRAFWVANQHMGHGAETI